MCRDWRVVELCRMQFLNTQNTKPSSKCLSKEKGQDTVVGGKGASWRLRIVDVSFKIRQNPQEDSGKALSWVGEGGSCLPVLPPVQKSKKTGSNNTWSQHTALSRAFKGLPGLRRGYENFLNAFFAWRLKFACKVLRQCSCLLNSRIDELLGAPKGDSSL